MDLCIDPPFLGPFPCFLCRSSGSTTKWGRWSWRHCVSTFLFCFCGCHWIFQVYGWGNWSIQINHEAWTGLQDYHLCLHRRCAPPLGLNNESMCIRAIIHLQLAEIFSRFRKQHADFDPTTQQNWNLRFSLIFMRTQSKDRYLRMTTIYRYSLQVIQRISVDSNI